MSSVEEKRHLNRVAALGCIACKLIGYDETPACIHHIRHGYGTSQRAPDYHSIPLCPHHHQHGGHGEAFHAGSKTWEENFDTEYNLLIWTYELLGYDCPIGLPEKFA